MDDDTFWGLLDKLDWRHQGDDDRVVAPVVRALTEMPLEEIESFQNILAHKLYALDGRAWAREIGSGWRGGSYPISGDEFLYARCVALVNGRDFYEAVLADPRQMLKDMEFESILYVAGTAWEAKTGTEFDPDTDVSYETWSNEAGWPPADPEPEVPQPPRPPRSPEDRDESTVKYDNGKLATRRVIRALIKGEIHDPVLDEYLARTSEALVMTPGILVEPPPEPYQSKGQAPPWDARIGLWTLAPGETTRNPSGLVAHIELQRVSPFEITARLLGVVEGPPDDAH